jgi:hypothetical protein
VPRDGRLVERLDAQAHVVHVAAFRAGRGAAGTAERAVDRHEVDLRPARAQVHEAEIVAAPLDGAADDAAVEVDHPLEVRHAEDDVVDLADLDHRRGSCRPPTWADVP